MWQRWNQTTHIFEKSDDDGGSWVPLPLDVSAFTEGLIDKARIQTSGTWTPTLVGSGGQSGQVLSNVYGHWRRVAELIFVVGELSITTLGTLTGDVGIGGLPVAVNGNQGYRSAIHIGHFANMNANFDLITGWFQIGASYIQLSGVKSGTPGNSDVSLVQGDFQAGVQLMFSGMYLPA